MKHYSKEEWKKYVLNELNEHERELYESHLYTCDQCMDLYVQIVTEHEEALPDLLHEKTFTNAVMDEIMKSTAEQYDQLEDKPHSLIAEDTTKDQYQVSKKKKKRYDQSSAFHYLLAAGMTVILMVSGAFHSVIEIAETVQSSQFQKEKTSVTEDLMDKTFSWMDSIDEKMKEGDKK